MIKRGILLVNLGSPSDSSIKEIRKFLAEFLNDRRVLSIPAFFRWLLLNLIILPFRPKKIKEAYEFVIDNEGSKLLKITNSLTAKLQRHLGSDVIVECAMRYREPSLEKVITEMIEKGVDSLLVVPLFPQYASATTGSIYDKVFCILKEKYHIPSVKFLDSFYKDNFFIEAQAELAEETLAKGYDHVVFSYHGVPVSHLTKQADSIKGYCKSSENCCESICDANRYCYSAQCYATSRALAEKLDIPKDKYTVCFQSRFGPEPWTQPYTADVVKALAEEGNKAVVALCPAFTADCLETLEEIAEGERNNFLESGGESFTTIACVNDGDKFVEGLSKKIQGAIDGFKN